MKLALSQAVYSYLISTQTRKKVEGWSSCASSCCTPPPMTLPRVSIPSHAVFRAVYFSLLCSLLIPVLTKHCTAHCCFLPKYRLQRLGWVRLITKARFFFLFNLSLWQVPKGYVTTQPHAPPSMVHLSGGHVTDHESSSNPARGQVPSLKSFAGRNLLVQ